MRIKSEEGAEPLTFTTGVRFDGVVVRALDMQ